MYIAPGYTSNSTAEINLGGVEAVYHMLFFPYPGKFRIENLQTGFFNEISSAASLYCDEFFKNFALKCSSQTESYPQELVLFDKTWLYFWKENILNYASFKDMVKSGFDEFRPKDNSVGGFTFSTDENLKDKILKNALNNDLHDSNSVLRGTCLTRMHPIYNIFDYANPAELTEIFQYISCDSSRLISIALTGISDPLTNVPKGILYTGVPVGLG